MTSDPIKNSEPTMPKERLEYVEAGSWPERFLSPDEARRIGSYSIRHYRSEHLERVEFVDGGKINLVIYHGHTSPGAQLIQQHQAEYGTIPMRVFSPVENRQGVRVRTIYLADGEGLVKEKLEQVLDDQNEVLSETRRRPDGQMIGRTEYTYNEAGDIILTREYGPDGELYDEIESGYP